MIGKIKLYLDETPLYIDMDNEQVSGVIESAALAQHILPSTVGGDASGDYPGGSKIEDIGGWVLGETRSGDPCIYLYSAKHSLQWKIATVWVEDIDRLGVNIDNAKRWMASAPDRDTAISKGFYNEAEFSVVMAPVESTSPAGEANKKYRFHSVYEKSAAQQHKAPVSLVLEVYKMAEIVYGPKLLERLDTISAHFSRRYLHQLSPDDLVSVAARLHEIIEETQQREQKRKTRSEPKRQATERLKSSPPPLPI